jgi:hypothetical protein
MEYKLLGASIRQIAEKLGISSAPVHQIVCKELAQQTEKTRLAVEAYRQLHLNQLDAMEFGIMQQARTGDVFAIDRAIKIQRQSATLLPGPVVSQKWQLARLEDRFVLRLTPTFSKRCRRRAVYRSLHLRTSLVSGIRQGHFVYCRLHTVQERTPRELGLSWFFLIRFLAPGSL